MDITKVSHLKIYFNYVHSAVTDLSVCLGLLHVLTCLLHAGVPTVHKPLIIQRFEYLTYTHIEFWPGLFGIIVSSFLCWIDFMLWGPFVVISIWELYDFIIYLLQAPMIIFNGIKRRFTKDKRPLLLKYNLTKILNGFPSDLRQFDAKYSGKRNQLKTTHDVYFRMWKDTLYFSDLTTCDVLTVLCEILKKISSL